VASKGDPWELYDIGGDRCETKNLAADRADIVTALEREWTRIAEECRAAASSSALNTPARKVTP
jgi:hypothetical protein